MTQRIVSHYGCAKQLPDLLSESGVRRIGVVVGASSSRTVAVAELLERLHHRFEVHTILSTSKLPQLDEVAEALPRLQRFQPDRIVAIGGGRILDLAKAMAGFATVDPTKFDAYLAGRLQLDSILCPIVAVPTTAGSGSESTHFAVVYRGAEKYSLASSVLRPAIVVLDGQMLEALPTAQRASCAFDALAQAVESYWANGATPDSRGFAAEALRRLMPLLPDRIGTGVRDELQGFLEAANLAGRAIDVSKTTAAHAFSYYFTYHHDVPHGQAVGLTLPRLFDVHERALDEHIIHPGGPAGLRELMQTLRDLLGLGDVRASDGLDQLQEKLGIGGGLKAIDFEPDRPLASVNQERLGNNPVLLSTSDIAYLLDR